MRAQDNFRRASKLDIRVARPVLFATRGIVAARSVAIVTIVPAVLTATKSDSSQSIDLFRLGGLFSHYRPRDIL